MRWRTLIITLLVTLLPAAMIVLLPDSRLYPVLPICLLPTASIIHAVGLWLTLSCKPRRIVHCGLHTAVTLSGCIAFILLVRQDTPGLAALWALTQGCLAAWDSVLFMKMKRAAGAVTLAAAGVSAACAVLLGLYAAGVLFL